MDEKDALITRQVAFKGAIETLRMLSTDLYKDMDEVASLVESLTDSYEAIIHKAKLDFSKLKPASNRDRDFDDPEYGEDDEDTRPLCNVCNSVLVHKTGVSKKNGKPWGGWMCPVRDCKGTPVWD